MGKKRFLSIVLAASVVLPPAATGAPLSGLQTPSALQADVHLIGRRDDGRVIRPRRNTGSRPAFRLFQGRQTPQRVNRPSVQRPQITAPRVAAPKITGPSFFNYAAPALSSVTIASLLPDMASTGSIGALAAAAQSSQIVLPPMVVLEGAPDAASTPAPAVEIEAAKQDNITLPAMTVLAPQPPVVTPAAETPAIAILDAAPVRLPSTDLFALAAAKPVDMSIKVEAAVADAVRELYAQRRDFLWSDGYDVSDRAEAVVEVMADAQAHGLDADHYTVDVPELAETPADRAKQLIAFDVELTARAVRFARDMKNGFIEPNKISGYHDFGQERLEPAQAATALADAADIEAWFASIMPQQPEYRALKAELAALRGQTDNILPIPSRIMLKPGAANDALPAVMQGLERKMSEATRQKHRAVIDAYAGTTLYDGAIVDLVRDVQRDLNLKPDVIVGPMTAARLAGEPVAQKIERIEFALERLRWHPETYGERQVVINAPEYRVRYKEGGETKLAMKAIVGKKSNQTNFFHDEIETVVFNPYWGVPRSIIVNTYLPKLRRDPSYLDRNGFVVTTASGRQISSSSVNWWKIGTNVPYNIRQKPGPRNALGELKILFPNKHAIYMH
ncbi:MAG: L,D-transpeptidase family protein, partial [Pseudomonadota bacterium]